MSKAVDGVVDLFDGFLEALRDLSDEDAHELVEQALVPQLLNETGLDDEQWIACAESDLLYSQLIPIDKRDEGKIVCPNCGAVFTSQDL